MANNIKKYNFRKGVPYEFEIIKISRLLKTKKHIITTNHIADFYHIIWFQKGTPHHFIDFTPIKIKPNTILFIGKDIIHRFDDKTAYYGKIILFTDSFFCKTDEDTKFLKKTILFNNPNTISKIEIKENTDLYKNLFEMVNKEVRNRVDTFQSNILQTHLRNILLHFERERSRLNDYNKIEKNKDYEILINFKEILELNYKTQKQVFFYTNKILITEKKLNNVTTKFTRKSPKKLIVDRVILEAKRMLVHTSYSIKEIGYNLGFNEPTNFIKYFKRYSLITPIEFRRKNQNG